MSFPLCQIVSDFGIGIARYALFEAATDRSGISNPQYNPDRANSGGNSDDTAPVAASD